MRAFFPEIHPVFDVRSLLLCSIIVYYASFFSEVKGNPYPELRSPEAELIKCQIFLAVSPVTFWAWLLIHVTSLLRQFWLVMSFNFSTF